MFLLQSKESVDINGSDYGERRCIHLSIFSTSDNIFVISSREGVRVYFYTESCPAVLSPVACPALLPCCPVRTAKQGVLPCTHSRGGSRDVGRCFKFSVWKGGRIRLGRIGLFWVDRSIGRSHLTLNTFCILGTDGLSTIHLAI